MNENDYDIEIPEPPEDLTYEETAGWGDGWITGYNAALDNVRALADDPTPKLHAQVWRDTTGEWRYRIRAGNGEIIASGEGYVERRDCMHALDLLGIDPGNITTITEPPQP